MLELFDRVGDETGVLEARSTVWAGPNVRLERGNAKALLVIEEEVDLSREEVAVIHGEVYALVREWVSANTTELSEKVDRWNDSEAPHVSTFGFQMLQRAPELVPRAMDVGFYRTEWKIEGRCDLLIRAALDVTQQYAGSILGT